MGELVSEGWSVLIFPEGERSATGTLKTFRGGVGMMASRLGVPVVPVCLEGVDQVLQPSHRMVRPARVRVAFGSPLRLQGDNYAALAANVERAVRALTTTATIR
jgi:1-acyl-sn-glycerol-3-phosphate acyltransferase